MSVLAGEPKYCPKGQSYFRHIGLFYYISFTRIGLFSNSFDFTALKGRFGLRRSTKWQAVSGTRNLLKIRLPQF